MTRLAPLGIVQRKGDRGFGAGNFRALFESIEREQAGDAASAARGAHAGDASAEDG